MSTAQPRAESSPFSISEKAFCQAMARAWSESISNDQLRISIEKVQQGWGEFQPGNSVMGGALCLNGQFFFHGFGTHADSEIVIRSEEELARFGAVVGLDQNGYTLQATCPQLIFSVEVKGRELWRSEALSIQNEGFPLDLELPAGTKELTLKAWAVDGKTDGAHADWAAAWVQLANGNKFKLGTDSSRSTPFSFVLDGKPSEELLQDWRKMVSPRPGKNGKTEKVISWTDPKTKLECRLELSEFPDHPVLEWVLYFRNGGEADTGILENIQALDITWPVRPSAPHENLRARVYRSRGSTFSALDFEYVKDELFQREQMSMSGGSGRSSENWLPFFNTDLGDKGVITAVGWSGQWACSINHDKQAELHIRAGMEKTHLKLHPGEEIRSPRIMQLFWKGDRIDGHNALRRFLLEHHTPHLNNKPVTGPFTIAHWGGMSTQLHLDRIAIYKREKLPQEYLWLDAGWYGLNSSYSPDEFLGDWHSHTGDWRVNPKPHPDGLRPIADAAQNAGMKFMLWIEPGRAVKGTIWPEEHPDWFLRNDRNSLDRNLLLNLGNPAALQGCIELLSNLIRENNIGLYREDFNIEPLKYWRDNDAPDRQGMTEILFNVGFYKLWDTLLERHPGLIIDNCSSGGRRIDLETISRSVALWRSDLQCFTGYESAPTQAHGMGLSYWLPLHGTGTWGAMPTKEKCSTYRTRSSMAPAFMLSTFTRESNPPQDDYPWDWFRKMCADYLRARPLFTGDYYPLTEPASPDERHWAVYQMNRPDLGEGFVMAFRRKESPWEAGTFPLHALDNDVSYEVEDADLEGKRVMTGKELKSGLRIALARPESSALMFYKKIKGG